MDNKLLNKIVTIASQEIKQSQYGQMAKIKDEHGKSYTIYQTKKDGTDSAAWQALQKLPFGATVQIGYTEEQKTHPVHGAYTARTIKVIDQDIGNGVKNHNASVGSTQGQTPRSGANSASSSASNDNFGLRLAIHGMVNGLLAGGRSPEQAEDLLPALFKLEAAIDEKLSKPLSMNVAEAKITEQVAPDIAEQAKLLQEEVEADLAADIPF